MVVVVVVMVVVASAPTIQLGKNKKSECSSGSNGSSHQVLKVRACVCHSVSECVFECP